MMIQWADVHAAVHEPGPYDTSTKPRWTGQQRIRRVAICQTHPHFLVRPPDPRDKYDALMAHIHSDLVPES